MRQQIAGLKRRQNDRKNQNITIDFKLLLGANAPTAQLPPGKPFTRLCELENRQGRSIFLSRADLNA
ncbi:hypothetical protein BPNPMPFG_000850 [Mesorhizobium sp. AR07]|uniref:hypothetical protein n=1 Tax=Mesorhizobium sp. AR07 TaxID=2865838 RepID=UPI00215EFC3D|nr:hypothetical protein [Mesorhizobium sp. AR07]UVK45324.1 hypothetical protein BPNPMPFG_000850 [Mesorhizobium sp. AR07]